MGKHEFIRRFEIWHGSFICYREETMQWSWLNECNEDK